MTWLLTRGRYPYLLALAVLSAWLGWHAAQVGIESSNVSLDSRDPAVLSSYEAFRAAFGGDEELLLAVTPPRLLDAQGLGLVARLSERIAGMGGVRRVTSLANAVVLVRGESGAEPAPLLAPPWEGPELEARARAALDRNPDYTGLLVSADRRTAGLLIELEERPGDPHFAERMIDALRALQAEESRDGTALHLTGVAVQKHDVSEMIARDQELLVPLGLVVLGLMLALFFRSALGVALPLAVTGVTVASTLGVYGLLGLELNAITSLLPPVLMVLSLAVSVHLIQGWLVAPAGAGSRVARIQGVVARLLFPCFFCSLTTALGFASLVTSSMPGVRLFGLFAALGVMLSFAIGMTLVPVGLSFLAPPASPREAPQHRLVDRALIWCADAAASRPGRVLWLFTALTVVAALGLPLVRNNTDLVRFLKRSAPLHRDTLFIDARLTGANALEFVVSRPDGEPLRTLDAVQRMAAFEQAILRHPEVTGAVSLLPILRQLQRAESGGDALALPADEESAAWAFDLLEAAPPDTPLLRKVATPDFAKLRFHVRIRALGTAVTAPLADAILAEGRALFGAGYAVEATGAYYRVAHDSNHLVASQVSSFGLALALVFLAIGALFRSPRLVLVAMVPNVMPVVWTGGMMGFLGIDLSTGTAMIASSVIGLVVDDTIHYLTEYTRDYRGDPREAARETTRGVGAALFMNNLILVLGFWVGCFGSFKPTIYFSLLSGTTMISALVCDLLVTPACLILTDRGRGAAA